MNRNIFSLVFNKAKNILVVASEIATGVQKASGGRRRPGIGAEKTARVLPFVFAVTALAAVACSAHATSLPSGSILDINNGTGSNDASYSTANVFQSYSVNYTATATGNNYLLFAFRQDPAYWTFGNVSLTASGGGTNLLVDPTFTSGGAVSPPGGGQIEAPASWGVVYQTGTPPYAAGQWYAPGAAPGQ